MPELLRLATTGGAKVIRQLDREQSGATDPIGALRFWEPAEKLRQRRRLHNAAVVSAACAVRAVSDSARSRYWTINAAANRWMFATVATDQLKEIGDALTREFLSAGVFERLEGGE